MPHVLSLQKVSCQNLLGFLRKGSVHYGTHCLIWQSSHPEASSEVAVAKALTEDWQGAGDTVHYALIFSSLGWWLGARYTWRLIQKLESGKFEYCSPLLFAGGTFPILPRCLKPKVVLSVMQGTLCFSVDIFVWAWSISQVGALASLLITVAKYLARAV